MNIIYEDAENACFLRAPFTVKPLELATTMAWGWLATSLSQQKAWTVVSVGQSLKAVEVYPCIRTMVVQG